MLFRSKLLEEYGRVHNKLIHRCKSCRNRKSSNWRRINPDKEKANRERYKRKKREEVKLRLEAKRLLREQKAKELEEIRRFRKEDILKRKKEEEIRKIEHEKLLEYRKTEQYKEEKKLKKRERNNNRMSNPLYAFRKKLTNNIRKSLTEQSYSKNARAAEILGAEWEIVFEHFNKLFKEGMSWNNHGEWHIDHIIPLCSAKTEEEIIKLNHYTNLQPLWGHENLIKGGCK